ncbi:hypothetical protein B7L44_05390 [Acinetobacter nosocomialis]|uniref:hypothetical protein n=1 Tax=Acinetobacter nosocomialis TaxID=106654 RepID=UPI0009E0F1D5|nr:hypothetical protein [Acinetobacter nosocomialis]ARG16074.1 hypothetical protein B7L44_05390 [Acinetobacter nosocomialis]
MSQVNPQVDVDYLNDFITKYGKKHTHNAEFQRRKLLNIAKQLKNDNPIQGQLAEASIEFHFCNYDKGIHILRNVLKLTQNQLAVAWDLLVDAYVQLGDLSKVFSTYQEYQNNVEMVTPQTEKVLLHVLRVYQMYEILQKYDFTNVDDINTVDTIKNNIHKLDQLGISVDVYRNFVALIYRTFYSNFKGTVEQKLFFRENELVIRVGTTVDDAHDLFDLTNKYNDQIFEWYGPADDQTKDQIEKITVYFMHKVFDTIDPKEYRVLS